ncbi:MAG: RHS domain-containing protein [Gammaproteobacteria bacterium]|nr:RHS domain-containing protein [Gammaproteobacteria bacterium]
MDGISFRTLAPTATRTLSSAAARHTTSKAPTFEVEPVAARVGWLVLVLVIALTVFAPMEIAAQRYKITYVHNDHLGRPIAGSDTEGRVLWQVEYGPFGSIIGHTGEVPEIGAFPGQYRESQTELSYNYHRWYESANGRYIRSDPIGLTGGLNPYAYVDSNPLGRTDRSGLFVDSVRAACSQDPLFC